MDQRELSIYPIIPNFFLRWATKCEFLEFRSIKDYA